MQRFLVSSFIAFPLTKDEMALTSVGVKSETKFGCLCGGSQFSAGVFWLKVLEILYRNCAKTE